jgi:anti-sigma B factor antagonist
VQVVAVSAGSYPVRWAGRLAVVAMPGEIDVSNAPAILSKLLSVLDRQPATLIVDMTTTTFCDSAGMKAVVRAYRRAAAEETELRLVMAAPAVRRVFSVTGIDRLIDTYPTLAAALAGRPPGKPHRPAPCPRRARPGDDDSGPGMPDPLPDHS